MLIQRILQLIKVWKITNAELSRDPERLEIKTSELRMYINLQELQYLAIAKKTVRIGFKNKQEIVLKFDLQEQANEAYDLLKN